MKLKTIKSCLVLLIGLAAASCEFDNFEEPRSTLSGRIVYNNEALGLRSNGVELELWQRGYDLFQKIPVYVAQDGTFSAVVFDGNYKMTLIRGNGPWMDRTDSIDVQVRGSKMIDVEVQPYYAINNPNISVNGSSISVTFTLEDTGAGRDLEYAAIFMGRTNLTDAVRNEGVHTIPSEDITFGTPMTVSVPIPANLSGRSEIFVRVGAKTAGVAELIYSQVEGKSL
jgi:hypothetical protein